MSEAPPPFVAVAETVDVLSRSAELLGLLRSAREAGLLEQLLEPCSPSLPGVAPRRLELVLELLASHGVVVGSPGAWQLAPGWSDVVAGRSPYDLEGALGLADVRRRQLGAALADAADYWDLPTASRLLVARGMSFDPSSEAGLRMVLGFVAGEPELHAALTAGGPLLELGCGVASRLTAMLRSLPDLVAVGVELSPDLVAFARERAERLGVADRLTVVCADATTWQPDREFAVVQWSQFFFPRASRAGALATALRALRPDGWVQMPVMWDGEPLDDGLPAQEMAAERLLLDLWDVPLLTTGEVAEELRAAGFDRVTTGAAPGIHVVRGRKPS